MGKPDPSEGYLPTKVPRVRMHLHLRFALASGKGKYRRCVGQEVTGTSLQRWIEQNGAEERVVCRAPCSVRTRGQDEKKTKVEKNNKKRETVQRTCVQLGGITAWLERG